MRVWRDSLMGSPRENAFFKRGWIRLRIAVYGKPILVGSETNPAMIVVVEIYRRTILPCRFFRPGTKIIASKDRQPRGECEPRNESFKIDPARSAALVLGPSGGRRRTDDAGSIFRAATRSTRSAQIKPSSQNQSGSIAYGGFELSQLRISVHIFVSRKSSRGIASLRDLAISLTLTPTPMSPSTCRRPIRRISIKSCPRTMCHGSPFCNCSTRYFNS